MLTDRLLRLTRGTKSKLKIARLYGSSIERLDFPVPGRDYSTRHMTRESKTDENLKDISIHHLIRQPGNKFADEINESTLVDIEEIKAYMQLVQEATIEELSHYDVIFCTTAMTTNVKLLTGMKDRIFQVIIDECGMCTEPEAIATIIATRAKQVVLIGDHMQLQPIVVCPEARRLGLQKSLFERYKDDERIVQLQFQYRMVNNLYLS
jgi:superfamily I DNA and/or RNA helicase